MDPIKSFKQTNFVTSLMLEDIEEEVAKYPFTQGLCFFLRLQRSLFLI